MILGKNKYPGLYRELTKQGLSRYRILINHNKEIIQEYFYFGRSTTEEKAQTAALKRWHELREVFPVISKRKFREIYRKPTASGIAGVTRVTVMTKGHKYEFWKATWTTIKGKKMSRQFSTNKYGMKEARELAIRTRMEALDLIGKS